MEFLTQLFDLLTSPSGSLVYFMVLVFCTVSAFWWSYAQWKSTEFPQAKRTVIGLGLIFAAQVTMFVMGGLAWTGHGRPERAPAGTGPGRGFFQRDLDRLAVGFPRTCRKSGHGCHHFKRGGRNRAGGRA